MRTTSAQSENARPPMGRDARDGDNPTGGGTSSVFTVDRTKSKEYFKKLCLNLKIGFVLAFVTPLVVLSFYFHFQFNNTLKESGKLHLAALAESQRNTVDLFLQERLLNIFGLFHGSEFDLAPSDETMMRYLNYLKQSSDAFIDVGFFDASGRQIGYAGPFQYLHGKDYSHEGWFSKLLIDRKDRPMDERKINLLIVDDEETFLRPISKRLEVRGFQVIAVNRGDKAIEAARTHPIDIALVDLKMPGMDGGQTLEILKKEHQWMEVVILTGHGSIESAVACTRGGAHSYLQKPCEFEVLLQVLTDAYKKKVMNKMKIREERMDELLKMSLDSSPQAILRKIRELDEQS